MKRGPKSKPYTNVKELWKPGGLSAYFFDERNLMPLSYSPLLGKDTLSLTDDEYDVLIVSILAISKVPMTRTVLQNCIVDMGGSPLKLTESLTRLTTTGMRSFPETRLCKTSVNLGYSGNNDVYTLGQSPSSAELAALKTANALRMKGLSSTVLGAAGECAVRSLLVASKRFRKVSEPSELGKAGTPKKGSLDLIASCIDGEFGISVKNQTEQIHAGLSGVRHGREVRDVESRCHDLSRASRLIKPWLITSFATEAGVQYCRGMNVRLSVMHGQFVPRRVEVDERRYYIEHFLDLIRPVCGPISVIPIGKRLTNEDPIYLRQLIERLERSIITP